MTDKRRIGTAVTLFLLITLLFSGCGLFRSGERYRDGQGPRRDGSGGGPCSWFSYQMTPPATTFPTVFSMGTDRDRPLQLV